MRRILFLLGVILGFSVRSFSQIQGDINDSTDKGISNAIVKATDSLKKVVDTVKSDDRGFYSFNNLKPGKYRIEVKAVGFQTTVFENIIVKEGDIGMVEDDLYHGQRLDITLTPDKAPK